MRLNVLWIQALLLLSALAHAEIRVSPVFDEPIRWSGERTVELHSHLFMSHGMTWLFRGDFFGPLQANSWDDRFLSQANPEALEQSGNGIHVLSLYAHPAMVWEMKDSIRKQIAEANRLVRESHGVWEIAHNAQEAWDILQRGKKALVLSLEGAAGIINNDDDIEEFTERLGIRIVTLLHLVDDRIGGVALLPGLNMMGSPLSFLDQLTHPGKKEDGIQTNNKGLTPFGRELAQKLIDRGVWLDLSHSSDRVQRELISMIRAAGQPVLYTHAGLRKYYPTERSLGDWHLQQVRQSGGILGMVPTEDHNSDQRYAGTFCPPGCSKEACRIGVHPFAEQYSAAVQTLGGTSVTMGTDFNGAMTRLKVSCGTKTSLDTQGFWNLGQASDLWQSLRAVGTPVPSSLNETLRTFLKSWDRVKRK